MPSRFNWMAHRLLPREVVDLIRGLRENGESGLREIREISVRLEQLEGALVNAGVILPIPPKHLQVRVAGGYFPTFPISGPSNWSQLAACLADNGVDPSSFQRVLDF